jgi:hypothetical protein
MMRLLFAIGVASVLLVAQQRLFAPAHVQRMVTDVHDLVPNGDLLARAVAVAVGGNCKRNIARRRSAGSDAYQFAVRSTF